MKSKTEVDKKTKVKELKANRFLLTVSQIGEGENKQDPFEFEPIKQRLMKRYKENIVYCCIGRERHKDKGWHTHVYLHLEKRVKYVKSKTFNFLCDKDTDVKAVGATQQDRKRALGYTRKGQDFIEFGKNDVDPTKQQIGNVKAHVIKMIWEGITFERIAEHEIEQVRSYVLDNSSHVKRMILEVDYLQKHKLLEGMRGIKHINKDLIKEKLTKGERRLLKNEKGLQKIVEYINVVSRDKWKRKHKSKNLLIWSKKPGLGKTTLFLELSKYCPMFSFPRDKWFDGYKNETFWMILWNETTFAGAHFDIDDFKNFLEGIPTMLEVKGSKIEKKDNPQIFMTANKDLKKMVDSKYHYEDEEDRQILLNALRERIDEVCVDDYENIFFLSKLIVSTRASDVE